MKLLVIGTFLGVAISLCGCQKDFTYKVLSRTESEEVISLNCPPRRIEVGLRPKAPIPEKISGRPINFYQFRSEISVVDKGSGKTVFQKARDKPIAYWRSQSDRGSYEFIALQEVVLPFRLSCSSLIATVTHEALPDEILFNTHKNPDVYVRPAGRP